MKRACVVGIGKSGVAAARLLRCQGWQVTVCDRNQSAPLKATQAQLEADGIAVELGVPLVPNLQTMQRIVVSPGVPWDLPALETARALGIETLGEMELAWRSLDTYPWVAITGTNGKTTVTSLIAAIFQAAGYHAPACGNIGYAACDLAREALFPDPDSPPPPLQYVIAEVSSYQIEASPGLAPHIGVWTTFTPDHLNRHKTLENYYKIKAQLIHQAHHRVLNGDDPYLRKMAGYQWSNACWTSTTGRGGLIHNLDRGAYVENGQVFWGSEAIVPVTALRMVGDHNRQNLLLAVAAACLAGIEREAIAHAITTFPGVPHRLEHICTHAGIAFINDSKATNYDAAEVGLRAVDAPVVLIAGGEAKAGDDTAWLQRIHEKAAAVLLIGAAAPAFAQRLAQTEYAAHEIVETMERAVSRALELARSTSAKGVLLSPACASFDQYPNFEARGDHFRHLCLELVD